MLFQLTRDDFKLTWIEYTVPGIASHSLLDQADSIHLQGDSIRLSGLSQQKSDELEKELKQLASSVATKGKAPAEEIRSVIIQLCKERYLTVDSLACYLNRNPVALRSRFLKPMISQGVLSLRYPNAPNRPDQAYTATEDSQ